MISTMNRTMAERIKQLREDAGLTQHQLAEVLHKSRGLISQWEISKGDPGADDLLQMAQIFKTTTDYLLGYSDERTRRQRGEDPCPVPIDDLRPVPVVGTIRAGEPILAVHESSEVMYLPSYLLPPGDVYVLYVKGDSMINRGIDDGDMAIIARDAAVEENDIAAVIVNGDESTIKRVHFFDGYVTLVAENEKYRPQTYRADEVHILGKVVWTMKKQG